MHYQVVLSAILPHYLEYLKTESSSSDNEDKLKLELTALSSLVTSINVLVKSSEVLTRLVLTKLLSYFRGLVSLGARVFYVGKETTLFACQSHFLFHLKN